MTIEATHPTPAPGAARRRRIPRDWLLLALLWLIHAIAALLWLRLDNRFPVGAAASQPDHGRAEEVIQRRLAGAG
ncbi:MAG: hypothetical protein WA040_12580, partial [Anaerolineae bacterium]